MIISHVKIIAFQISLFCTNYRFSKTVLYIINRKIHGCLEIPDLFLVLNMISHSFAALTREISCSTLEINLVFPRTHVLFSIYSPQVNITKQKFSKRRLPVLWKFTDKEISEIKINSVSKNTKACVKIIKQLFASRSVIIGEYSPRLRLGEYSPIITSPSANN